MQQGHNIVVTAADEAAWSSLFTDSRMTEGRHPCIASAEGSKANVLAIEFRDLTIDALASIGVETSNRIIATMIPVGGSPDHVCDSNRAAHVARLDRESDAQLRRLNALTACITRLVAVEHAYVTHFNVMNEDVYQHGLTDDPVCAGCELTEEAQSQSRARLEQSMQELCSASDIVHTASP
jgi:hypothetical protein